MQIVKQTVGLTVDDSLMRVYVAAPEPTGQYPGILFYSDIYQLGRPITHLIDRLAGYGFVVAAPEIWHRLEPIGAVIEPDDLGRLRGNDNARRTAIAAYDADARAALDWLKAQSQVLPDELGAVGFCIGGHLAFRAALQPEVEAVVCCYPTGIHNGKLGRDTADTLGRVSEIQAEVLTIFGSADPHVPPEGRQKILQALDQAGIVHKTLLYEANHTFMRDDGYRYDPAATDIAWSEIIIFLRKCLG
ncbi:MAG: dienelactone hydrolase family protein [Leptolyngbyaceae cyanobacterium SM1_1_3]|nr:dienelactone hydrolase family protein [Leptolyngbyaceae cyanobacterium SM1_1_3]NJN01083.1 dienelactone hydrolase family protein [Leptolyngbyaceae cyanobacterium RM1_1_2]NJO11548.1 dienelactone hydrolase family protein [Leptolyngbyaceae cyanobacterium SL_1_1]